MDLDHVIERSDFDECPTRHGYTLARVLRGWVVRAARDGNLRPGPAPGSRPDPADRALDEDVVLVAV